MTETKRISELPDASTLDYTEVVPLVQDGSTRKSTIANMRAGLASAAQGAKADTAVQPGDIGTASKHAATDFATAAQGAKADSAVQPGDIGTAATHAATDFATAAEGALASTAVQPSALGTAATHADTDFATAAEGALATTAVQPSALGTAASHAATDFATAAEGALANTAVQPSALAAIATTGDFANLFNAPMQGLDNAVINGCCRMSQRASVALSGAYQYGAVDLIAVRADGAVSAGTIQQDNASTITSTGYACTVSGATLGSGGVVYFRHRIEAKDTWRFKNGLAYFSCRAYHNAGAAVNFTVTIRKPTAVDNFAGVTDIQTATQSIPSATASDLTLAISNIGDVTNGIEIEVKAVCGAVTAANFTVGDLQLVIADFKRPFLARPFALEEQLVFRFLRSCYAMHGIANSTSAVQLQLSHLGMRTTPTYIAVSAIDITDCYAADYTQSSIGITSVQENTKDHGRLTISYFSGLTSGRYYMQKGTNKPILASAEF